MSDRAYVTIKVLHCPGEQTLDLQRFLDQVFNDHPPSFPTTIAIEEYPVEGFRDSLHLMATVAPGATWQVVQ
jgi:hypothetical protein